uniref:Uncharacterized protein n=2 Tax=Anguilla anguilla TaxID=7936 RepID=A0A0E9RKQ1_ANGAN
MNHRGAVITVGFLSPPASHGGLHLRFEGNEVLSRDHYINEHEAVSTTGSGRAFRAMKLPVLHRQ